MKIKIIEFEGGGVFDLLCEYETPNPEIFTDGYKISLSNNEIYYVNHSHRDNNGIYHSKKGKQSCCSHHSSIRVPSLKRSKRIWKKFYELFPSLKDEESLKTTTYYYRGSRGFRYAHKKYKLKKV